MRNHPDQHQCYALIDKTTRLRMAIDERAQEQGHEARLAVAAMSVEYHLGMAELLALTPAHDAEGERRQAATRRQHLAQAERWNRVREEEAGQGECPA